MVEKLVCFPPGRLSSAIYTMYMYVLDSKKQTLRHTLLESVGQGCKCLASAGGMKKVRSNLKKQKSRCESYCLVSQEQVNFEECMLLLAVLYTNFLNSSPATGCIGYNLVKAS